MPQDHNPPSLWSFSLERYAKPGVEDAALALQEDLGADVNLLFYCAWCAVTGRSRLDASHFDDLDARISSWRADVTEPLRGLRMRIETDPVLAGLEGAMDVREKVLSAEVDSERIAQIAIESAAGRPVSAPVDSPHAMTEGNLRAYLAHIEAAVDDRAKRSLRAFVRGIFAA